ncbi:MAG: hypothetical protein SOR93_03575 [Clostridiales Family XIII bacterium]|uniref:hypothetical protein n=1 Tax=Hominibacterium faecale TaxID=2839743 RepID=UPI0022B2A3E0|nr:hypothetical protein [Hominibacterium faecale]MCI7301850.1 hypothetical protein [Clostridia bacterium]MDY3010327.1 hypothetical protein [Clostridiales Family XIII bacterium]
MTEYIKIWMAKYLRDIGIGLSVAAAAGIVYIILLLIKKIGSKDDIWRIKMNIGCKCAKLYGEGPDATDIEEDIDPYEIPPYPYDQEESK